jgi:hypothetical protein
VEERRSASSFHLGWQLPPGAGHLVEARVTLEITDPPVVDDLYFWALQVDFPGAGGAHLGLQWNRAFPGFGAANWGGYAVDGALLSGMESPLPSTPGDPNTRDYQWQPERAYRLHVRGAGEGLWRGEVIDLPTNEVAVVRDLRVASRVLARPMVWSEVFARCDDATVTVRWSDFAVVTERGDELAPEALVVNYQSHADGGCANTTSMLDARGGALQITNAERITSQGARLPFTR